MFDAPCPNLLINKRLAWHQKWHHLTDAFLGRARAQKSIMMLMPPLMPRNLIVRVPEVSSTLKFPLDIVAFFVALWLKFGDQHPGFSVWDSSCGGWGSLPCKAHIALGDR